MSGAMRLRDVACAAGLDDWLSKAGMAVVAGKSGMFSSAAKSLQAAGAASDASVRVFWVPGRIEVLGKHTDYAGGRSMIAAIDRGFCIVAAPRDDGAVHMIDAACGQDCRFEISAELSPTQGHWSNYPMSVARRLARNFPPALRGADIAFASDLPAASGMSSSSAMIVGTFLVFAAINALSDRDEYTRNIHNTEDLAGYLGTVENGQSFAGLAGDRGVGTFGGSEDHTAILCCGAGAISQYSYCPVRFERAVLVPDDYVFVIGFSGVVAEKTGPAMAKYNRASLLASAAAEIWRRDSGCDDPHLAAAVASGPDAAGRLRQMLSRAGDDRFSAADLTDRFEQFLAESTEIIPAAADALAAGDVEAFGRQVDRSQELARTLLKNQVPETVFLARAARELGAAAASSAGAGFGGSVWAMTKASQADQFARQWAARYSGEFPSASRRAAFFITRPGPAAMGLSDSP